mmetsp:Transcript_9886/g.24678  ORF Transcript_9886/g.24678 Transcript_9886/m.24678 type:complete len:252 (+) Transcript_9886:185-940(+)
MALLPPLHHVLPARRRRRGLSRQCGFRRPDLVALARLLPRLRRRGSRCTNGHHGCDCGVPGILTLEKLHGRMVTSDGRACIGPLRLQMPLLVHATFASSSAAMPHTPLRWYLMRCSGTVPPAFVAAFGVGPVPAARPRVVAAGGRLPAAAQQELRLEVRARNHAGRALAHLRRGHRRAHLHLLRTRGFARTRDLMHFGPIVALMPVVTLLPLVPFKPWIIFLAIIVIQPPVVRLAVVVINSSITSLAIEVL